MRLPFALTMMVSVLATSIAAQEPPSREAAVVHARLHTTVSGTKVLDEMAVFSGDDVVTHEQLPAEIILKGTTLRVLGKSHVQFRNSSAELLSGGVTVTTTTSFKLQSKCFSAQPAAAINTRYSVVPEQGRILVSAEDGEVVLRTKKELRIPAGKTATITSCGLPEETTSLIDGKSRLKYILAGAGAAGGGAAALPALMGGGCKQKVSSGAPDDCQ